MVWLARFCPLDVDSFNNEAYLLICVIEFVLLMIVDVISSKAAAVSSNDAAASFELSFNTFTFSNKLEDDEFRVKPILLL